MPVALITLVNIVALIFVYKMVYNGTESMLLQILLHASYNTANGLHVPLKG
jgi:hypothetical protein